MNNNNNNKTHCSTKRPRLLQILAGIASVGLTWSALEAASLTGRVFLEETENSVRGAQVEILDNGVKQLTSESGVFRFNNLEPGDYTIRVSYSGTEPKTIQTSVGEDQSRVVNVTLSYEIFELDDFVVVAELEGNAASLVAQQNAVNVTNDIALDAYGSVADGNIGDFIRRVPGVSSGALINGDIGGFDVRGTPQALSTVSIDGSEAASANAAGTYGDRSFPIDIVPAELIESLTLTKALTPDMPADSIGGNVNLVSKSAFKVKGRRLNYKMGFNVNTYRDDTDWGPTASLTYLDHLGDEKRWGLAVSASYSQTNNTQDRTSNTFHYAGGDTNVGAPIVKSRLRIIDGEFKRERTGLGIKLERKATDRLTLLADFKYTLFDYALARNDIRLSGVNREIDYSVVSRESIFRGGDARESDRTRASLAPGYTETFQEMLDATIQNYRTNSTKETDFYSFRAAANLELDNGWIKADATHSRSTSDYVLRNFYIQQSRDKGISIDEEAGSNDLPLITELYNVKIGTIFAGSEIDNYTFSRYSLSPQDVTDEKTKVRIDFQKQFEDRLPFLHVQSGVSFQRKDYFKESNLARWNHTGDSLSRFIADEPTVSHFNFYPAFDEIDGDKVDEAFINEPEIFSELSTNVVIPPSLLTEDIFSAYAMTGLALTEKASLLAGVRMEHTDVDGTGSLKFRNSPDYEVITRASDYTDYFPGVHFRYAPNEQWVFRASFNKSMGRPSITRQVPATTIITGPNPDDPDASAEGSIIQNNVGLNPMYSDNFDLSAEWYLPNAGLLSVGAFSKDISGYISRVRSEIGEGPDNGWDGEYAGFTYITDRNLSDARVRGVEFSYSQNLVFLPKPFETLSLNANLTLQETSGTYDNNLTVLPQFKDTLANVGVSYRFWRMRVRANYNYASDYLSAYNDQYFYLSQYTGSGSTVDLNVHYKITPRHSFFIDVNNVFNEHPNVYIDNNPDHVVVHERNGTRLNFGLFGRF